MIPSRAGGGFTLLEIMMAVAILAISLMWMAESTSNAIMIENHARMVSTATFLARFQLVELEDELQEKGFTDDSFSKETTGDFENRGFKRFKWARILDKVELPSQDEVQTMMTKGMEGQQGLMGGLTGSGSSGSSASGGLMGGAGSGLVASQFGMIKDVLEQGIRRARVTVSWNEGKKPKSVEVVEYLTDPKRVDMALQMPTLGNVAPTGSK
jgi:prepilin-type N-terminal cleavage/methylation domain-containing protein